MKHFGDISALSGYELPIVDVITGGSPCQDLSVAGGGEGLSGERSGLFMEQIRLVKEMRERDKADGRTGEFIRPRYMVWENVPGAFGSNGGVTSKQSLQKSQGLQTKTAPKYLCLVLKKTRNGSQTDVSTMTWVNGALLGEYTTHSFGECPKEENESRLSQILEDCPHPKYYLSEKACLGILRRTERRGKKLPEVLEKVLNNQARTGT